MNIGAAYPHGSYSEWWQLVTRVDNIFAIRRTEFKNDFVNKYRRNREREINQARFEEICKGLGVAVHDLY